MGYINISTMLSLTFDPVPVLQIGDESYHGINIIEKLYELKDECQYNRDMYDTVALLYLRPQVPRIGFKAERADAVIPTKKIWDVGYDLTMVGIHSQPTPMTTLFETGIAINIPLGFYVELVPRSSISKTGYMLANSVGIIDPGFIGTVKVPLIKIDPSMPDIKLPAQVAQLILKPYIISDSYTSSELIETSRGTGAFGSTG